ncbi:MAG: hypothetical protein GWP91_10710 [Rhodobacterales bacterium]|nr:hypothetical protein [Rhodobacterales bacterium]
MIQRLIPAMMAGAALFASGLACELPPSGTVAIQTVAEGVEHPDTKYLTLTAESKTEFRGISQSIARNPRGFRGTTHEIWIVPIVDPGAPMGDEVMAWVTLLGSQDEGADPSDWFAILNHEFDGKTHTLKVIGTPTRSETSGWVKAIHDAEAKHGLRSHPDAPIFFFPIP